MSELNNEIENEEKCTNKKGSLKRTIIFLFVFTALCVSITAFLIYRDNYEIYANNNEEKTENSEGIQNRDETYDLNDIKIIEKEFHDGDLYKNQFEDYYKVQVSYFEIDGLKDKNLQKEINKRIEEQAMSMYSKDDLKNSEIDRVCVYTYNAANFSNILSIEFTRDIWYKDSSNLTAQDEYVYETMNINLINGEDIPFQDIFVKNAPIKNILSQAAYNNMAWEYPFNDDDVGFLGDMDKSDYSTIENKVFEIMSEYNKNKDIKYVLYYNKIYAYIGNYCIDINMVDIYDKIAIFNKYKDYSDLYDGKYENTKDILLFTYGYDKDDYLYRNCKKISDNLFVDIIFAKREPEVNAICSDKIKEIQKQLEADIEKYKNANDGKSRYIYVYLEPYGYGFEEEISECEMTLIMQKFETDDEYYQSEFYPFILDSIQNNLGMEIDTGSLYPSEFSNYMKKKVTTVENEYINYKYNFEKQIFEEEREEIQW